MVTPFVGQWNQDTRNNAPSFFAGSGFTGGTLRYSGAMTVNPNTITQSQQQLAIAVAITNWADNPTITWSGTGVDATTTVISDNLLRAVLPIDQGNGAGTNNQSYCCPFSVRASDGTYSKSYVMNRPRIYGLSGTDPTKLYYGTLNALVGRHLRTSNAETSLWLWDGNAITDATKQIFPLTVVYPGGTGSGIPHDKKRVCQYFEVPSSVPAGNYYLIVFTNENYYGINSPTAIPVTVMGSYNPWLSNPLIKTDLMKADPYTDITTALQNIFFDSYYGSRPATEANPWIVQLPPGVFYLSHTLVVPPNVGIVGQSATHTRIMPNPTLTAFGNTSGSFYYDLEAFSKSTNNCYATSAISIVGAPKVGGIFAGDLRVNGRSVMINIKGSNTYFKDLSFEGSPDGWRQTVRSVIGAGSGVNRASFERVRIVNDISNTATGSSGKFADGAIYRIGLWKYWRFRNCEYNATVIFEGTDGALNGFSNNGAFDNGLVQGGVFRPPYGALSASTMGNPFGRQCLIDSVRVDNARRGFNFTNGTGSLESVITSCIFDGLLSEQSAGEVILHESRGSSVYTVTSATSTTVTISGDTANRTRWTAYIISGTGKYQFRVIQSSASGVHTLESAWEITPDNTSKIMFVQAPTHCAYVFNRVHGAIGGINLYGSAFACIAASNWIRNSHEGLMCNTNWNTAATSGAGGQSGDGRSVSVWHSFRANEFEDGVGHHFVAPRTTADLTTNGWTDLQIGMITSAYNVYCGDVTNQAYACEGVEQGGNENGSNIATTYLINGIAIYADASYSDRSRYQHNVISRTLLPRAPWFKSLAGTANITVGAHTVDDISITDQSQLIKTSAAAPSGKISVNDNLP